MQELVGNEVVANLPHEIGQEDQNGERKIQPRTSDRGNSGGRV